MKFKLILPLLLLATAGSAQLKERMKGDWGGKLNLGPGLRIVFHISENSAGGLVATADSPDQSAYGIKCDTAFIHDDSIRIEMRSLFAYFAGKLTDDTTLTGKFTQNVDVPLILTKGVITKSVSRPQTPQPPFPYKSEEVEYDNVDKTLHYGATITIPEGRGPFPAAVMITGSGPQDRDETISGHKPFAVIADELTKNGFVILRVDDRGVGKSTGKFVDATSADFAEDVNTSLNYLLSRSEVDKKRTGLIGHSEGAMIAPIVASRRADVNFIVLLAAPGIKIDSLMVEQNAAIQRSVGISEAAINSYLPLYKKLMKEIIDAPDTASAKKEAIRLISEWRTNTNAEVIKELELDNEDAIENVADVVVQGLSGKWFKYFIKFDPQVYLQKLKCKVLAINGTKDIQVIPSSNLPAVEAALKKNKVKTYSVQAIPGLNHLFQECTSCTLQEYGELEQTISPKAITIIKDWLNKNVK